MTAEGVAVRTGVPAISPLECRDLPAAVSRVAEHESWRKEWHRPATYVHKWWARRLGTVFRRLLLDAVGVPDGSGAAAALTGFVVYDPFAGAGTTLVEAAKLGARVVARDINPVATLTQRQAMQGWRFDQLELLFAQVEAACRSDIDALFVTASGEPVLHYFWVAVADCPECNNEIELFSDYIFAHHAYPRRHPGAHATCPTCHAVCPVTLGTDADGYCDACARRFSFAGPVKARVMTCVAGHRSKIIDALAGRMPRRRMYAKVVKTADGRRKYQPVDAFDLDLYNRASKLLADSAATDLVLPDGVLEDGTNTVQALRWGYNTWASFFNDRQLYCLGRIGAALRDLPGHGPEREALAVAFGKTLEHHNLFCSFKGEGTGPVRSIFHNHVLRPERCSVEGNPWGADGGSGGYAETLGRLRRAHEYKSAPTELVETDGAIVTVAGRSGKVNRTLVNSWQAFCCTVDAAYIVTGDAAATDIPDGSVTLVVTDPPYVDNVHYSELADFFHAWMRGIRPYGSYPRRTSTRDRREVQNGSADGFEAMIAKAWRECARVLRDDGLLVFSFHQSQESGWVALMRALANAGFIVTAIRPVVAEVTTSLTKVAAAAPNRIDVIVVCRKRSGPQPARSPGEARAVMMRSLTGLRDGGLSLGEGDVRSAVRAAVLSLGTWPLSADWAVLRAAAKQQADLAVASFFAG